MSQPSLQQLYSEHHGKVSDKWSLYLAEYHRLFESYRNLPIRLLEIGVQNGGSLEIWGKYFRNAQQLVGCDINSACGNLEYEDSRIAVIVGDANAGETEAQILAHATDQFDIIIDDGSHRSSDIVKSFARYFPHLKVTGLYIVEDLHCSYWQEYEGGLAAPYSSVAFFKRVADITNFEHWGIDKTRKDLLSSFFKKYDHSIAEEVLEQVHSVEFINSMCVIRKHLSHQNRLGARYLAGSAESVVQGLISQHSTTSVASNQRDNTWATCIPVEEELQSRLAEIEALAKILDERDSQLDSLNKSYEQMLVQHTAHATVLTSSLTELEIRNHDLTNEKIELLGKLSEQREILNDQARQIAAIEKERIGQNTHLAEMKSEIDELKNSLDQANAMLSVRETEAQQLRSHIVALQESRSWRMTAPFRRLKVYSTASAHNIIPVQRFRRILTLLRHATAHPSTARYWLAQCDKEFRHGGYQGVLKYIKRRLQVGLSSNSHRVSTTTQVAIDPRPLDCTQVENAMAQGPLISILMPVFDPEESFVRAAIDSVLAQKYEKWELCIVDDASTKSYIASVLQEYAQRDARVRVRFRNDNGHISVASNDALDMATGSFVLLLDHDDMLTPTALLELAHAMVTSPQIDFWYSDEDKLDSEDRRILPIFKPDFSPELLYSQNYICHVACVRRSIARAIGGFRTGYEGAQDYDLFLRIVEQTKYIGHIGKVLYHWRMHDGSTAQDHRAKPYAHIAGTTALQDHFDRCYGKERVRVEDGTYLFTYDVRFNLDKALPKVSIIIPTKDKVDLLTACLDSIFERTTYANFEVIVIDNNSEEVATSVFFQEIERRYQNVRVICAPFSFNWSRVNNVGVQAAAGDIFIFLNNDTVVISSCWMTRLAEHVMRDEIGTAGGLLLYPDETIQHAGVVVGMGGWADHVFKGTHPHHIGSPFVSPMVKRNVLANTGACLAVSRRRFAELGEFDETFTICGSDVEYSIRAHKRGYRNVYDPYVKLYHHESKTRTAFVPENDFIESARKYAPFRDEGDPFYNQSLSLHHAIPTIKREEEAA